MDKTMKHLLIYINPSKDFDKDYNSRTLVEFQIDNSLEFCNKEDLLFVTNFPYEYHGVNAFVVEEDLFCINDKKASKVNTIIYLLENNMLGDLTWFHDLDAFQLHPIDVELDKEIGFTSYGWNENWNTGSIFFKPSSLDIFKWIREGVYSYRKGLEERALKILTDSNFNNINSRYQKMNITYNLGMREIEYLVSIADKPIKVVHFPPNWPGLMEKFKPILTERFTKLVYEKFTDLPKP